MAAGAVIGNVKADVDQIASAMKGINFRHANSLAFWRRKPYLDFVLARRQFIRRLLRRKVRLVAGQTFAYQPRLSHIDVVALTLQQGEWLAFVFFIRMMQ